LTNAQYVRPSSPNNPNAADIIDTFNEKLSYDKNGNIQSLVRNGGMESQTQAPLLDNLAYQYDTTIKNKLIKVTDITANTDGFKDGVNTTEEYGYDPNGNMIRDDNKNIQRILYNHLNLPTQIVFQNGGDFPSISYLYTATGKRVAKTVNIASRRPIIYTVDYLDGYQYESGKLLFFPTAEGYVKYTEAVSNPFDYVFNYTDHLGNIRLSYGINPGTGVLTKIEENNYYPFGLKHATYNNTAKMIAKVEDASELAAVSGKYMVQKIDPVAAELERPPMEMPPGGIVTPEIYSGYNYKYQGQERQDELGLNWDSFKWRNYDMAIGRFMSIDPLAEKYSYQSPYNFSENRVVDSRELEGLEAVKSIDGNVVTVTVRVRPENC
jgi:RHS repeat-associated protein